MPENRVVIGVDLTQEEWDTVLALRQGRARVVPVSMPVPECQHVQYENGRCVEVACMNYAGRRPGQ